MASVTFSKDGEIVVAKCGSVSAKIYPITNRGKTLFTLAYYHVGRRIRKNFADLQKAKEEAASVLKKKDEGHHRALQLEDKDRDAYVAALEALKPTGKRIEIACAEYAEAWKNLKGGSIIEAARYYARHHHQEIPQKKIPEILSELIEAKKSDGASDLYLKDLKTRLDAFAEAFQTYIASVTTADIDDWLRRLKVGARSRNNYRNCIVTLFRFARDRGYLQKNQNTEADALARAREIHGEIGILGVDEMKKLLEKADSEILPFLLIGGFSGIRHWEMLRLHWEDVKLKGGHIVVPANKARKVNRRRIVPISDNLARWLKPYHSKTGPVCEYANMSEKLLQLAKEVKIEWPRNGLRHSYGTYRMAVVKNAAQVAYEMGNSPQMVRDNYDQAVPESEGKKWFAIVPPSPAENVIPMIA